ncbi:2Fe-2S iron-sulfur cluster binding domain-containing protein [Pseudonocardia asaccharolytica]|uniref:Phenol hydroxylase P5 protein n=1 Tax=Pseudonocardia asaccharolytica DSM 44247 = NBRC 16224 TaxID=1123024 RepID=A0A511D3T7_9PSEU|nr:2Fe-2S iron-sulfur cluster binding domain-containing protein [Pseudonocardia asaccharolytica]GEL19435.1 phenol hydroxylase P5 protein [Pseudonocardia asaccharolytica DSM 44247 = NBRC 16224]
MNRYAVTVAGGGPTFEAGAGERILGAARRAGVWLPFECGWGSCALCKVTLVEGEVGLLFPDAPAVTPRDARRRRILTCQSTPRSDLTIKPLAVGLMVRSETPAERPTADHTGELVGRDELGPDIRRFVFRLERAADFREGQYAILDFGDGLRRCYSMSSRSGSPLVEFVTKRYPGRAGSERLHSLPLGATVELELPYGDMWLRPGARPVVLIAGGVGISAVLALLRQLHAAVDPRPVLVFYGAGSRPELVCWDEVEHLVHGLPGGSLHGALTSPENGWPGTNGLVTDALAEHLPAPETADHYLAGPPPMVDAVLAHLRARGVELTRIHYDRFG